MKLLLTITAAIAIVALAFASAPSTNATVEIQPSALQLKIPAALATQLVAQLSAALPSGSFSNDVRSGSFYVQHNGDVILILRK